jgi:hypothetical protein
MNVRPISVRLSTEPPDTPGRLVLGMRGDGALLLADTATGVLRYHHADKCVLAGLYFDALETWHCNFHTPPEQPH